MTLKPLSPLKPLSSLTLNPMRRLLFFLATLTLCYAPGFAQRDCVTLAVFALNDFHGAFVPSPEKRIPGAAAVCATLDSLKRVYPLNLTLATGDNFGGSYFYNATYGALMPAFLQAAGITYSAVGNHEFDDGQEALALRWRDVALRPADFSLHYLCANVRNRQGVPPSFATPLAADSVVLPSGRALRIALCGLITGSTPQQTRPARIQGLSFDGRYGAVLDSLQALPQYRDALQQAAVRLLVMHVGTQTSDGLAVWDDAFAPNFPADLSPRWHAAFTAHTHQAVSGRIGGQPDGLPVVQGLWHGEEIGVIKLSIDTLKMQVQGVETALCPVSYAPTLSPAALRIQQLTDSLLRTTRTAGGAPLGQPLTYAKEALQHNRTNNQEETLMGWLVTRAYVEALRHAAPALTQGQRVIGVSHFGSIRAGFARGKVSVLDVGEALPFANALRVYRLTGTEVAALAHFGLNAPPYGQMQCAGLRAIATPKGTKAYVYVTPEGKEEALQPKGEYLVVADEYITTGGDGYPASLFPTEREVHVTHLPQTTDAFIRYLQTLETLPTRLP